MEKKFGWTLSKKSYFFNLKFIEAEFLHNSFWLNLVVYNTIQGIYWLQEKNC